MDLDINALLADAPVKPGVRPSFKNCVRIDIWQATLQQLQAELLRLDQVLLNQRLSKNKAENAYKCKRRQEDPEFRENEAEYKRLHKARSKASPVCVQDTS